MVVSETACDLRHKSTWRSVSCTAVMWCRKLSGHLTNCNQDEPQRTACGLVVESCFLPAHLLYALQLRADRPSGEAYREKISVVETTMSVCEPASMVVGCYSRHGKNMSFRLMYGGDVVPKDVNAAVATIKTKRTIVLALWAIGR